MKPLSVDNAELVNDEWPNKHEGSLFFIKRLIEWNPNIGAFNENNELMGWCLRLQSGPLGALQVRKKFQQRGVGTILIVAMCKILANSNVDTFAFVGSGNFVPRNMFVKLGFKYTDDVYWLKTHSFDDKLKWSDDDNVNGLI